MRVLKKTVEIESDFGRHFRAPTSHGTSVMTEYTGMQVFAKNIALPRSKFRRCKFASPDRRCYQKTTCFFPLRTWWSSREARENESEQNESPKLWSILRALCLRLNQMRIPHDVWQIRWCRSTRLWNRCHLARNSFPVGSLSPNECFGEMKSLHTRTFWLTEPFHWMWHSRLLLELSLDGNVFSFPWRHFDKNVIHHLIWIEFC